MLFDLSVGSLDTSGTVEFATEGDVLTGLLVFRAGSDVVDVSVTYDGKRYDFKYDLETGKGPAFDLGPDRFGDEPVFVPRPGATEEDDGWLVTFVHDRREGHSELWVIDARSFDSEPVARVRMPTRVPIGFHAAWVPRQGLG